MKPKNQLPYFPHDANSRNKDKMIRLRIEHGVAGYGVYFMLLERLRNEEDFTADLDYEILAYDFDCEPELVQSVIIDFGLFEVVDDGQKFHSVELTEKMEVMQAAKNRQSEAARRAAEARWNKQPNQVRQAVEEPSLFKEEETSHEKKNSERLDKEIESLKQDKAWQENTIKILNLNEGYFTNDFWARFRNTCLLNGLSGGHKDMSDATRHCSSYIRKTNLRGNSGGAGVSARGNYLKPDKDYDRKYNIAQTKLANKSMRERWVALGITSVDNIFRNKGYEPGECEIECLDDPEWLMANKPSHPEWKGLFQGHETVEDVEERLQKANIVLQ